ncbi:hypothetical protein [Hydrogenimonas sp.]
MNTILKRVILIFCLGTLVFAGQPGTKPMLDISTGELAKGETGNIQASLLCPDGRAEDITARVTWIVSPSDAVSIQNHTLTALKDGNVTLQAKYEETLSNPVTLTIYWEVDGHRLPPEPDPKINNATLLGVDVNHNGVRDDVERWIYRTYKEYIPCKDVPVSYKLDSGEILEGYEKECEDHPVPYHPVVRAVAMQGARAAQIIIQDPKKAQETLPVLDAVLNCDSYITTWSKIEDNKTYTTEKDIAFSDEFKTIQFNTVQRARAYSEFNFYLSGGVYSANETPQEMKESCSIEVKKYIKDLK